VSLQSVQYTELDASSLEIHAAMVFTFNVFQLVRYSLDVVSKCFMSNILDGCELDGCQLDSEQSLFRTRPRIGPQFTTGPRTLTRRVLDFFFLKCVLMGFDSFLAC
jgi:hypothetical protein